MEMIVSRDPKQKYRLMPALSFKEVLEPAKIP